VILVAGESLMDLLVDEDGTIAPRPGGGPFNTARAIARLGEPCTFLGRFADDRFGRLLQSRLVDDGVGVACPEPVAAPTTLALAELGSDGQAEYRFYFDGTAATMLTPDDVRRSMQARPRAVHVGTLGLVLEPMADSIEGLVAALPPDVLLMVDANCRAGAISDEAGYRRRLARILRRADVLKVSHDDLAYLVPGVPSLEAARSMRASGATAVLLTWGPNPTVVITARGEISVAGPPARVVDTVGAGDVFGGAFLAWWSRMGLGREDVGGLEALRGAVAVAARAAALNCERVGADPPRLAELDGMGFDRHPAS
jgi:fructokinase